MIYDRDSFAALKGHTLVDVNNSDALLEIKTLTHSFKCVHHQDCCEHVYLERDGFNELKDLVGATVQNAYVKHGGESESEYGNLSTWVFYHIRTDKGDATLRFCGESNGYYSHSVDIEIKELSYEDEY